VGGFKPQQHHLSIRGRDFHFVSYEGRPADLRRNLLAEPSMWYLMCAGRRWPALLCDRAQTLESVDAALRAWAEGNAVGPVELAPLQEPRAAPALGHRWENWWGPT
jgi:hypothetical protein